MRKISISDGRKITADATPHKITPLVEVDDVPAGARKYAGYTIDGKAYVGFNHLQAYIVYEEGEYDIAD